jgi:ABC-type transport system involved in multi-copper enzyme maturation permease subunit
MRWSKLHLCWPHLIGPLLRFELLRLARSGRLIWLRCLYALALLTVLWMTIGHRASSELGQMAEGFSLSLLVVQNIAVLLLAPLYFATSITDERQRGTLDLLLTTHLCEREIVLDKYLARALALAAIVLAGVPVLALVHFLGGVNLWLVFGGFAITAVTILQAGSVCVLCSALARGSAGAVVGSYALMVVTLACCLVPPIYAVSNPFAALVTLDESLRNGPVLPLALSLELPWGGRTLTLIPAPVGDDPLGIVVVSVIKYALYQGLFIVAFLLLSVRNLRRYHLAINSDPDLTAWDELRTARNSRQSGPGVRPDWQSWLESDSHPLWNKEMLNSRNLLVTLMYIQVGVVGIPLGTLTLVMLLSRLMALVISTGPGAGGPEPLAIDACFRICSVWAFLNLCVSEAIRTVDCISREREGRTLECLLTVPLTRHELLNIKWLAGCWHARWLLVIMALLTILSVLAGMLHPLSAVLLLGAGMIHALFFAALGLWLSIFCRTSLQARLCLGIAVLALIIGPLLLLPRSLEYLYPALCPPYTWTTLIFGWEAADFAADDWGNVAYQRHLLKWPLFGVAMYGAATIVLWWSARWRFERNPFGKTG